MLFLRRAPLLLLEGGFCHVFWPVTPTTLLRQVTRVYEAPPTRGSPHRGFAEYGGVYLNIITYTERNGPPPTDFHEQVGKLTGASGTLDSSRSG